MCNSSHFVGIMYFEGLQIDAQASQEQVFQRILGEFENLNPKDFPPEKKEPKPEKTLTRMSAWWEAWEGSRNYGRFQPQPVRDGVSDGTYFYYTEYRDVKVNLKTFKKLLREKKLRKKLIKGSHFHVTGK